MNQPLTGVRVIDLTRILSGPFCTMLLGDMGADVIKVEAPGKGDPIREQGAIVNGLSWYFAAFNRNKSSLTLDLKSEAGKKVLERLIAGADVLVENYRPGVLASLGFGPDRIKELNPRLIVASVNGYGSTGPYADRPAFDFIAQAMSGFMSANGTADMEPLRAAPPLTDLLAGLYTAFGVVCALRARDRDGQGQAVEASMMNAMISMFAYLASENLATGALPARTGNDHPISSPYGLFQASDGMVAVAPSTAPVLRRFLSVIGLDRLDENPRFDTNAKRLAQRNEINALINERMRSDTQESWIARLNAAGVPCGKVQSIAEALSDPQVQAQEMVISVEHPGHGPVRMTGFPVKFSRTPCQARLPSPDLGAHSDAVLAEIGFSRTEIAALREKGVI